MKRNSGVVAVIPARGGSKGLPRKNIRLLAGKPLIAHAIDAARQSKRVGRVLVTTDSQEIADVALKYGAEVPFIRPAELAEDSTPPDPVLKHALDFLLQNEGIKPEIIVWLEPPCPIRSGAEIDKAVHTLEDDPQADSLRSVCEPFQNPYKSWVMDGNYLKPLMASDNQALHTGPRQRTPKVYWQNGALFLLRYDTIMNKGNFFGDKILPFVMPSHRFIDIDKEEDLAFAEWYLKTYKHDL